MDNGFQEICRLINIERHYKKPAYTLILNGPIRSSLLARSELHSNLVQNVPQLVYFKTLESNLELTLHWHFEQAVARESTFGVLSFQTSPSR